MSKRLVIVESPAKARTIERFLPDEYTVKASMGHMRDLPKSKLGVDIEHDFAPQYIIPRDKQKVVRELKDAAKKADEIILATDEDREGEAIAWHLLQAIGVQHEETKRVVFHEV
ncbi:MAG TPA: toprim domain-containing protein, partial [bacterium]|nr:toprim domain-containing protein [bacterium]